MHRNGFGGRTLPGPDRRAPRLFSWIKGMDKEVRGGMKRDGVGRKGREGKKREWKGEVKV